MKKKISKEQQEKLDKQVKKVKKLFKDLDIELCGTWIWVSGLKEKFTKEVCSLLKENGFRFSRKKLAWYYTESPYRRRSRFKNLNEIRESFGSENLDVDDLALETA